MRDRVTTLKTSTQSSHTHLNHLPLLHIPAPIPHSVLDLTLNVYYGWNLDALNAPLVLLRALTEAPQAAAPIQVLRLCLCSQWAAWDWADPPLRLCSLPSLRRLELSCQISQRALSSILGAAGPGLRELELNRKERGLGLLTLLGSYEQPPPFAWLSTLERLTLYSQPISNGALRAVDRAMGCLPALETLKVLVILVHMDLTISSSHYLPYQRNRLFLCIDRSIPTPPTPSSSCSCASESVGAWLGCS